jgi:4-amino-4-deoxy-L-arabinose transferase-like glycosyltransferase
MFEERLSAWMWLSWVAFLAGLWLIVSPFLLGYRSTNGAMSNDVLIGVIVAVLALIMIVWARQTASWLPWIAALVGIWEIAAPFLLGYADTAVAAWNGVILGIIILVVNGARGLSLQGVPERRYGPTFPSEERPKKEEGG